MVAGVQDSQGNFLAIHRTYFDSGAKKTALEPAKASLGPIAGGAVQLTTQVASRIEIAEGIETALSILQATGIPTWAALGTANLAKVELPDGVREVIVCADADEAGEKAALAAAKEFIRGRRRVRIARPPMAGDFNDLLRS
jgi:phage/plasmid primase-like uncharacterized protein